MSRLLRRWYRPAAVTNRRTLAIVANEFFEPALGRMGGFGWAARGGGGDRRPARRRAGRAVRVLRACRGERLARTRPRPRALDCAGEPPDWPSALAGRKIDALLLIDYRPSYAPLLRGAAPTPALVWVRNPRAPGDCAGC